jgi:hypothetical protein
MGLLNTAGEAPRRGLLDSVVPTPVRLYWDSIARGKRGPISEADFTPEELAAIRRMVEQQPASQGGITYANYSNAEQPGIGSLLSPGGRVATSLGQFTYQRDPEGVTVSDNYDFNPIYKDESPLIKALSTLGTLGFSGLHMIGEHVLPPGKGRPVKIRLPNR